MQTTVIIITFAAVLIVGAMVAATDFRRESRRLQAIRALANRMKFKNITANGREQATTSISLLKHREYAFSNMYSGIISGLGVTFFDIVCSQKSAESSAHDGMGYTEMTTRVKVHLKGHNLPHFILMPQRVMTAMMNQLPLATPITFSGDINFNRDNVLLGDEASRIHSLFDSPVLRALFANNETLCLEGKQDTLTVFRYNLLLSASQLESLIERAVKIACNLNY